MNKVLIIFERLTGGKRSKPLFSKLSAGKLRNPAFGIRYLQTAFPIDQSSRIKEGTEVSLTEAALRSLRF